MLRSAVRSAVASAVRSMVGEAMVPSLNFVFAGATSLDPRITFTRSTTATRVNGAGLIESVAINGPRFDHDPVTKAPKGLLIEEQRANLCLYSEDLSQADWLKGVAVSVTYNTGSAPDGTNTAETITFISGTDPGVYQSIACSSSTAHTFSFYVKLGTMSAADYKFAIYDNTNSAFIASDIVPTQTPSSTAWTRITYTFTTPATCVSVRVYCFRNIAPANASVHVWGVQLEAGAFATSYIPTTTVSLTRAADSASVTGTNFTSWFNVTQGTMMVEAQQPILFTASKSAASISDGSNAQRFTLYRQGAGAINVFSNPGGAIVSGPTATAGVTWKSAFAYGSSPASFAVNRVTQGQLVYTVNPNVFTELAIGNAFSTGAEQFNGHIRAFKYFPRRLSDADLRLITS